MFYFYFLQDWIPKEIDLYTFKVGLVRSAEGLQNKLW